MLWNNKLCFNSLLFVFLFLRSVGLVNDILVLYRCFEFSLFLWCKFEYLIVFVEFVKIFFNNNIKINFVKYLILNFFKIIINLYLRVRYKW